MRYRITLCTRYLLGRSRGRSAQARTASRGPPGNWPCTGRGGAWWYISILLDRLTARLVLGVRLDAPAPGEALALWPCYPGRLKRRRALLQWFSYCQVGSGPMAGPDFRLH